MKKGISLSIETVVVLILAVAVLVALLFFFSSIFTGGKNDFDTMNQQRDKCSAYASANTKCTSDGDSGVQDSLKNELAKTCKNLNRYSLCTTETFSNACAQQCCSGYCAGGAKDCRSLGGSCEVRASCPNGEITQGTPDCQTISTGHKCCR